MERTKPYERDAHSDKYGLSLPPGKTCGDCVFFNWCVGMVAHIATDEICDWAPMKFIEATAPQKRNPPKVTGEFYG